VKRSRQRYGVLLIALVATFSFLGLMEPSDFQRIGGTVLVGATLMLALNAAEIPGRWLRTSGILVGVLVVAVVIASIGGNERNAIAIVGISNGLLVAVAPWAVVKGVLRNLRQTGAVTVTVVAGVLCLYLLLGLFFAFVYTTIQGVHDAPFFANGATATSARSVYFSFVTLATVGYGDYTAATNLGHTLSITEALLGQIYLVTVVATIVSRLGPRRAAT
jgi:hypothetical protein